MLSLKLNTVHRLIGGLLLVSLGVLITLLVLTFKGSAIPAEKASSNIDYFDESPSTLSTISRATFMVDSNGHMEGPISISTLIQSPYKWQAQPIRLGAGIAAAVTGFLGLLYVGLKLLYRNISKEIFP